MILYVGIFVNSAGYLFSVRKDRPSLSMQLSPPVLSASSSVGSARVHHDCESTNYVCMCKVPLLHLAFKTQPQANWTVSSLTRSQYLLQLSWGWGTVRGKGGPRIGTIFGPGGPIIVLWTVRGDQFCSLGYPDPSKIGRVWVPETIHSEGGLS